MSSAQSMYVALLGRPGDPAGLAYFNETTHNGLDYTNVNTLLGSPEFYKQFSGQQFDYDGAFVDFYYERLFGRHAGSAEQQYFSQYAGQHAMLARSPTLGIAIMESAQGSDLLTLNAKISTADRFTAHLDTGVEIASYSGEVEAAHARDFLFKVDASHVPTDQEIDAYLAQWGDIHSPSAAEVVGSAAIEPGAA